MSIFRSYFSKNNTLIKDNETNNSQNPVTEISYGTSTGQVSRFIFDIDLQPLINRINDGTIYGNSIVSHRLNLTNTIKAIPTLVGGKFADQVTQRASSFTLEVFNVDEDWDEGNGYDFVYIDEHFPLIPSGASNWTHSKTNTLWSTEGIYVSGGTGATIILGNQTFYDGSENLSIDITDYVNSRIMTGTTGFTATTFGLGIKFTDDFELLTPDERQAVAFHAKDTHTFFEPYVETTISDNIIDDRYYFYLDKDNNLYLYANAGNNPASITVTGVTIIDYNGNAIETLTGDSIQQIKSNVYRITLNIDSLSYPDSVLFTDRWSIVQNDVARTIDQKFYLIDRNQYYTFNNSNRVNFDNYTYKFIGIYERDKIRRGDVRRVEIDIRQLYPNQNHNIPLDVEYRLFINQGSNKQIDVIPFTKTDRTSVGYEFFLDTSWLIPQDYNLELKISNSNVFITSKPLRFTIVSDGVIA